MKKLILLLLALILCLAVLVACDRDKESETSARPSGDSELNFYYRQTKQVSLDKAPSESFYLAPSYSEYVQFAEGKLTIEISEDNFDNVYVFLATRVVDDDYRFMGYYGLGSDANGYWINAGVINECDEEVYNSDGTVSHYGTQRIPFSGASSSGEKCTVMYEVVIVPKTDIEFEIDASKPITVYKTTYHFVSSN